MGLIMDVVPNHMAIATSDNHWWNDVLENGRSSPFAAFFDIDWHPPKTELHEKVLLPVLGEQYGRVLENQEIAIEYDAGAFYARYWQSRFPIGPRTILPLLEPIVAELRRSHPRRAPRRPRDREHRHRDHAPADPLGHRAREGPRAHAREGDRQAAPRRAGVGQRRRPRRAGAQPGRDQRRQAKPAQLRPAGGAARRPGLPPQLLGRRRRGDQLPPLLRHQRPGRDPRRAAQRARRRPRQGVPAAARRQGDRAAHRSRRRPDGPVALPREPAAGVRRASPTARRGRPTATSVAAPAAADLRRRREDPDRRRGAAARVAGARHDRLRVPEHGQRPDRRRGRRARHRAPLPAPARRTRRVRRSVLPGEAPHPAHRDVERALRAGPAPGSHLGAAPLVARLHPEQPSPGAGRGDRLLPGLPHLYAGDVHRGQPRRSPARAARDPRRQAPQPLDQRVGVRLHRRPAAAARSRRAARTPTAPSAASSCSACSSSPGR